LGDWDTTSLSQGAAVRIGVDRDHPVAAHVANAEPRPIVVVVFLTPPLIESTAIRKSVAMGC
jgi:hypothetical protein